jgi:hypothetical protein
MSGESEELRAGLSAVRERLLASISGVSEDQFKKRPPLPEGESGPNWCIAEVLAHLLQQERLRAERIGLALTAPDSQLTPSTDETHYEAARAGRASPVPQLIHGLLASRREIERLLADAAAEDGSLERSVVHPRLGGQTVSWILREKVIVHEAEHVAQIEEIKARLAASTPSR